jgi:hypothetical protein
MRTDKRRHRGPEKDRWRAARRGLERQKRPRPAVRQTVFAWFAEAIEDQKEGGAT